MNAYMDFAKIMNLVADEAHTIAVKHGFYTDQYDMQDYFTVNDQPEKLAISERDFVLAQLAKIGSEVGEAVAVVQKEPQYDGLAEELADIVIRTFDLASFMGYHFGEDIMEKMEKNKARPMRHGKIC